MPAVGSWEAAVETADESKKKKGGGFQTFGLDKPLLDGIIKQGYVVPTPVQRKAIPPMLQGNDVVAMARTGSGKTAAFLIPMLQHLKAHSKTVGIRGLILSPTRELSLQIMRNGFALNKYMDLRFAALVGGNSLDQQFEMLASNPDIVVATPGRILHIMEEASLHLTMVRMIVLDEADRLFELGLQPQIVGIMQKIPESSQRALFSATMPSVLAEFTNAGLHNPVVIRLDAEMKLSDKLKQSAFLVRQDEKVAALIVILKRIIRVGDVTNNKAQALIFVESKFHVDYLQMILSQYMISNSAVHGQMDQEARRISVRDFAKRNTSVMIVTDVAARGLDLPLLDNVINFSFPFNPKLFVHRVGRVARAGRSGTAYSILTFEDFSYYVDLMHFLELPLQCRKTEGDLLFTPDDGCYGRLAEEDIQLELDFLRRLHNTDVEIKNMSKVVDNAHKKFNRTKKKPTHEAIQEARKPEYSFDKTPIHPMLLETLGSTRINADTARFDLKRYKAKELFLEMGGDKIFEITRPETLQSISNAHRGAEQDGDASVSAAKKGSAAAGGNVSSSVPEKKMSFAERMLRRAQERKKRERDEDTINSDLRDLYDEGDDMSPMDMVTHHRAVPALGQDGNNLETGKYRDEGFFMDSVKRETAEDTHYSVKDATMDITAETAEEAALQRNVFAWSKKKNRYVKMHVNDAKALLKGVKNEAGKAINYKNKLEAYSKWVKKSNMRIQDVGEDEDLVPLQRARAAQASTAPAEEDEDYADISDPNQGKKLRIGRKQKRLPKDGHVRTFEELSTIKRKAEKEKSRLANKQKHKKKSKK